MAPEGICAPGPFLILAPANAAIPKSFQTVALDSEIHSRRLSDMQIMRGEIALAEGAIHRRDLDPQRRHTMPGDEKSWHILRVAGEGAILGCVRVLAHPEACQFPALRLASSAVAGSAEWGPLVRAVVEADMERSRECKITIVEPGGWVLKEVLRGSQEAITIALSVFAWSQLMGGCVAYVTATVKHGSSSMLRRLGARSLRFGSQEVPRYYDPEYSCEMEMLRIEIEGLNPRFEGSLAPLRQMLSSAPVVQAGQGMARSGLAA